jgi:N-formylglutamate deformylase
MSGHNHSHHHHASVVTAPPTVSVKTSAVDHAHDAPVVFDSPHSGTDYPEDFVVQVARAELRRAEDTHVEKIFASAPSHGATLIAANFPRAYIDANRSLLDIDQALLDAPWPGPINASKKTEKGIGLVWRKLDTGANLYNASLSVAAVQERITSCYSPYHKALRDALNLAHEHYGAVWHINCHSMPAISSGISEEGPGVARADFVLGDRDSTTCSPAFTDLVATTLRNMGYHVKINDPYKGVELVRAYSEPSEQRHSLQVEINRRLYMNEDTREMHDGFAVLQKNIDTLIATVCAYARAQLPKYAPADVHSHTAHVHGPNCNHGHHH